MNMPNWWLGLSGVFFALAIVASLALIAVMLHAVKLLRDMQPRIQQLSDRMDDISKKLDSAVSSAKSTVETVGASARNVAGSVEGLVVHSSQRVEKLASIAFTAITLLKLFKEIQSVRRGGQVARNESNEA
jgi:predicted PurR-regulated permease PerM